MKYAAAVIAVAVAAYAAIAYAQPRMDIGRYQLEASGKGTFRIDTITGAVSYCYTAQEPPNDVVRCYSGK